MLALTELAEHQSVMLSAAHILQALAERGVQHTAIAKVLGVAPKNATRLYVPEPKTGKTRKLTYDEGILLIDTFGLDDATILDEPLPPLSEPVSRLVVLHVADQLGATVEADGPEVSELARDVQAFSRFAADRQVRESVDRAQGFFAGLLHSGRRRAP